MKPLIIIIVLTLIIIVGGCLTLYALETESQRLSDSLSALDEDINNQNWDTAAKTLKEFHEKWDKTSKVWSMLVDHYEIDNIELVLSQLTSYVETRDKSQALAQMSSLKELIRHIPAKEAFRLKNLF